MTTFRVSDVLVNKNKLETKSTLECLTNLLSPNYNGADKFNIEWMKKDGTYNPEKNIPEAFSGKKENIVESKFHGLIDTIHYAFANHYPLILDPDSIWLTIIQGLARHIQINTEELRHQFVDFKDKTEIEIRRDSFIKGSSDNDWESCFNEFSAEIKSFIGKKHDLIISNFSTTGVFEKVISEIALMDAMKQYFTYTVLTKCGIPRITLLGTVNDWKNIKQRVQCFDEFGLSWWTNKLIPVLDQFIAAANNKIDRSFWQSIYKINDGSGGPYISGWINKLLPYVTDYYKNIIKNKYVEKEIGRNNFMNGLGHYNLPKSVSQVPFIWKYYNERYNMQFTGGIIGIEQQEDMSVKPKLGWAVSEINKDE